MALIRFSRKRPKSIAEIRDTAMRLKGAESAWPTRDHPTYEEAKAARERMRRIREAAGR